MRTISVITGVVVTFFLLSSASVVSPSQAQATQQATESVIATNVSSVVVTFPIIVSELHGIVPVKGTANLTGMRSYFLEWHLLNPDATIPTDDVPWVPATLPTSKPVQAGILANWDTTLIPDGLYELRLTVTRDNAAPTYYVVTPLRINNALFPTPTRPPVRFTLTPTAVQASLLLNGIVLNPPKPTCGSTFTVTVNVNNPTNAITAAGTVYVQDVYLGSGTVTATGSGDVPALNPGANYVVKVPLTIDLYYNEVHEVRVNIASSQITSRYTLTQGNCNVPPTTPSPTVISSSTQIPSPTRAATAAPTMSATTVATTPTMSATIATATK